MAPRSSARSVARAVAIVTFTALAHASRPPSSEAQPQATAPRAVFFVGGAASRRWEAYAIPSSGAAARRLGFSVDAGSSGSSFHGTNAPRLSPDGRTLAYFREGRLRVRDLVSGTEREVPTTLARTAGAMIGGFAIDSSALLFFDITTTPEVHPEDLEESGMAFDGTHRIFVLATGDVRTLRLDEASESPAVLENASTILVVSRSRSGTNTLVRRTLSAGGVIDTPLVTETRPNEFGQLVAAEGRLAWLTDGGIAVADAGRSRVVTPSGTFAEYQWPTLGPTEHLMTFHHMRRVPTRGGGAFEVRAEVTTLDPVTEGGSVSYVCRSQCSNGFEDEHSLLVLDGDRLLRIDESDRSHHVRSSVRAVAFRGERL